MIKFKTKQGFTIYKSTFFECISATGGLGICDWCNRSNSTLYIIPVLNSAMCPECYEEWMTRNPKYFEEDRPFEEAYIRHFENMAKENNVPIEEKNKVKRLTRVFAETTHGTKGYEPVNEIRVNTESIHNLSEVVTTLGTLEDILEKYGIENLEEYISGLREARKFAIKERNTNFSRYIKETIKNEELETELAKLKQKAIVPKFQVGQECWGLYINHFGMKMVTQYILKLKHIFLII